MIKIVYTYVPGSSFKEIMKKTFQIKDFILWLWNNLKRLSNELWTEVEAG